MVPRFYNVPHAADSVAMARYVQRPRVALIGRPNVGKSTLCSRLTGVRLRERRHWYNSIGARDAGFAAGEVPMDSQDYFAPVRHSPEKRPKPPRPPYLLPLLLVIAGAVVIAAVAAIATGWLRTRVTERSAQLLAATTIPAAEVRTGEAWQWRELASFDWEVSELRPRPAAVLGDYNADGLTDILLIDLGGATEILGLDGSRSPVRGAEWRAVSTFVSWDYDANGIDELVPTAALYHYQPKAKGFATVRRKSGG